VSMFSYAVTFLGDAITATRHLKIMVVLFIVVVATTTVSCLWLIPEFGLIGGAMALLIATIVRMVGSAAIVGYALRRQPLAATAPEE
jgi:O-antigen/teichoic acid export membrane protein